MAIADAVLVGLGGAVGASARYGVEVALADVRFPIPTLVVNVLGSFALALVAFAGVATPAALLVGVGFCGSLTTYSTFSVDTVRLFEESPSVAFGYAAGTLVACLLAVGLAAGAVAIIS